MSGNWGNQLLNLWERNVVYSFLLLHFFTMKKDASPSIKKDVIWMAAYVALLTVYIFQCWWCISSWARCLFQRHSAAYHQRRRLLKWALITSQTWSPLFLLDEFQFILPQKSFPRCLSTFQITYGPQIMVTFLDVSHVHIWFLLWMIEL